MHSPFVERAVRPDMQESVQAAPSRGASLRVRPDGVAIITLSNGPMNALHPDGEVLRVARPALVL